MSAPQVSYVVQYRIRPNPDLPWRAWSVGEPGPTLEASIARVDRLNAKAAAEGWADREEWRVVKVTVEQVHPKPRVGG